MMSPTQPATSATRAADLQTKPNSILPITVIVPTRNESANVAKCLTKLNRAERVIVVDSASQDETVEIARSFGAEVINFQYQGGFPKKRQWILDHVKIDSPWVLLIDADEVVPDPLWREIAEVIASPNPAAGYLIRKGFCFLGRKFKYGGFSHEAVLLFQTDRARFEQLDEVADTGLDMEVHERLIVEGPIRRLRVPVIHEDLKGLSAYLDRHNKYATWEAAVRHAFLHRRSWGSSAITPRLFGNSQERRRFLKQIACRIPGEPWLWFFYHYFFRLGILEGRPGLIASRIRAQYISNVRAKMYELELSRAGTLPA